MIRPVCEFPLILSLVVTEVVEEGLTGSTQIPHSALHREWLIEKCCPHLLPCWQSHLKLYTCSKSISLLYEGLIPRSNALFKIAGTFYVNWLWWLSWSGKSYEVWGIIGSDGVRRIYLLCKALGNPCELTQLI